MAKKAKKAAAPPDDRDQLKKSELPRQGHYDLVMCLYGPFRGIVMSYDDDALEGGVDCIVVHCDEFDPYDLLPRKWFRYATDDEHRENDEEWLRERRENGEDKDALDKNERKVSVGDEILFKEEWYVIEAVLDFGTVSARRKGDPKTYRELETLDPREHTTQAASKKPRILKVIH